MLIQVVDDKVEYGPHEVLFRNVREASLALLAEDMCRANALFEHGQGFSSPDRPRFALR